MPENSPNQRPSSRKTQRYRQQGEHVDQSKRNLLKILGVGGAAIAVGGTGVALKVLTTPTNGGPDNSGYNKVSAYEGLTPENQAIRRQLEGFNREIIKNPAKMVELAPTIGAMGVEFFCKEMGYDQNRYKGRITYLSNTEYVKAKLEDSGCIETDTTDDEAGTIKIDQSDLVLINRDAILHRGSNRSLLNPQAAFDLFGTIIHELHHASSPVVDNPDNSSTKLRGMGILMPDPKSSRGGQICFATDRQQLEETVVQDSTDRMVKKLGIVINTGDDYRAWVQSYQTAVVDKLFGGDHKPLLALQQQTKPAEFLSLVGQKLGAEPQDAKATGENYLIDAILYRKF